MRDRGETMRRLTSVNLVTNFKTEVQKLVAEIMVIKQSILSN